MRFNDLAATKAELKTAFCTTDRRKGKRWTR